MVSMNRYISLMENIQTIFIAKLIAYEAKTKIIFSSGTNLAFLWNKQD